MLAVCIEQALGNIKTCKNIPQTKGRLLLPGRSTREVFVTFRRGTSVTSRGTGQEQQVLCWGSPRLAALCACSPGLLVLRHSSGGIPLLPSVTHSLFLPKFRKQSSSLEPALCSLCL